MEESKDLVVEEKVREVKMNCILQFLTITLCISRLPETV